MAERYNSCPSLGFPQSGRKLLKATYGMCPCVLKHGFVADLT